MFEDEYNRTNELFASFINSLTDIQDSVQHKWYQFKHKRCAVEQKIQQSNSAAKAKKISLDVGGTIFKTTEETLLKEKESFFWAMLRSGQWMPDEETGTYFIDRDPHMFSIILAYLRDGKVWTMPESEGKKQLLKNEVDFYGLTSFPEAPPSVALLPTSIRWVRGSSNCAVSFSDDHHTVLLKAAAQSRAVYAGPLPDVDVVQFTLKLIATEKMENGEYPVIIIGNKWLYVRGRWAFLPTNNPVSVWEYNFFIDKHSLQMTVTSPAVPGEVYTIILQKLAPPELYFPQEHKHAWIAIIRG